MCIRDRGDVGRPVGVELGRDARAPTGFGLPPVRVPHERLVVRGEHEVPAVRDLDAVPAGFSGVEVEALDSRVLRGSGLDAHTGVGEDRGGAQHLLAAVDAVGEVVQPAAAGGALLGVDQLVPLDAAAHPRARLGDAVRSEDDLVGAQPETVLPELPAAPDVAGEQVDVVEAADVGAPPRVGLRGGRQRGGVRAGRHVALGLVVEAEGVPVGVLE